MSLETRLLALVNAIGPDVKALQLADGDLSSLSTTAKGNLVAAINEVYAMATGGGATINDTAGNGDTSVVWSADKTFDEITAAINSLRDELRAGAGAALDTFAEVAAALADDDTVAAALATDIANRVRFDAVQSLTAGQQLQARQNINAVSATDIGDPDQDLAAAYATAKA